MILSFGSPTERFEQESIDAEVLILAEEARAEEPEVCAESPAWTASDSRTGAQIRRKPGIDTETSPHRLGVTSGGVTAVERRTRPHPPNRRSRVLSAVISARFASRRVLYRQGRLGGGGNLHRLGCGGGSGSADPRATGIADREEAA